MPDSSANYFTTGSDGSVGAVFPGGVSIEANTLNVPTDPLHSVQWTRNSDGAMVAEIVTLENKPGIYPQLTMLVTDPDTLPATSSKVTVVTGATPAAYNVRANADTKSATIIDGSGNSSFVQGFGYRLSRRYTATYGATAPGTEWTVTVALDDPIDQNLVQHVNVFGGWVDGFFSAQFGQRWALGGLSGGFYTTVDIVVHNLGTANNASGSYLFNVLQRIN